MNLDQLISKITPLYNKYKTDGKAIKPSDSIVLMWELGDVLKSYIEEHAVKPHNLYREIYGMSEGSTNVARKSWITREFQGRCFRIRNIFKDKDEIEKNLGGLSSFTLFRESMPFFDNPKYQLKGEEMSLLLNALNSSSTKLSHIRSLQKKKIGITNSRTQKLDELEADKLTFIEFYNYIFKLLQSGGEGIRIALLGNIISDEFIELLAVNTNACTQDGLKFKQIDEPRLDSEIIWHKYWQTLENLTKDNNPKVMRRFRRLIPPERISKLADMLYKLNRVKNEF